jgi:hypothetical protein
MRQSHPDTRLQKELGSRLKRGQLAGQARQVYWAMSEPWERNLT